MIAVLDKDLTRIETPGRNISAGIATPSRGANEVSLVRQRQLPGGANPLHRHDREEVITVLAGSIVVSAPDESVNLAAGDSIIIPAEQLHRIEATGDQPADWLLVAPAGIRFFHENGDAGSPPWAQ